jgi:hypothetical protein
MGYSQGRQSRFGPAGDFRRIKPQVSGAEGEIVIDSGHKKLIVRILKYQSYPPAEFFPNRRRLPLAPRCIRFRPQFHPVNGDTPPGDEQYSHHSEEETRLSRAIGAQNSDGLPFPNGKTYAPDRFRIAAVSG